MKKLITLLMLTAVMMVGCKTKEKIVEHYQHDTLTVDRWQRDSIYVELLKHDSVTIREKGDTVLIERWHTQYKWRELHDTTYIAKVDSIPYPVDVTKEVPAKLTWWQQTRLHLANILLMALALCAVVWIGKNHIKRLMP
jgi:hypothetical protein